jgi:hydrogenase expression/formation protein HypE
MMGSAARGHPLPYGKVPHKLLNQLLEQFCGGQSPEVLLGPAVGLDAAALRVGNGNILVAATDPITFATDRIGWYAVHVNANDVAVCGACPRWFLATVLLPRCEVPSIEQLFTTMQAAAHSLGVTIIGGHTEITAELPRPIVVGTMLGMAERLVAASGARPGDVLLATKGVPIEGAAVAAREFRAALQHLPEELLHRAQTYLDEPGISVVPEALIAARLGAHALHDVTEGGILTAAWELAEASGCGVEVELPAIPVLPEAALICQALRLDPYRTLGSGCLLIASPPEASWVIQQELTARGIPVAVIGRCVESDRRVWLQGRWEPLVPAERDELARLFEA